MQQIRFERNITSPESHLFHQCNKETVLLISMTSLVFSLFLFIRSVLCNSDLNITAVRLSVYLSLLSLF